MERGKRSHSSGSGQEVLRVQYSIQSIQSTHTYWTIPVILQPQPASNTKSETGFHSRTQSEPLPSHRHGRKCPSHLLRRANPVLSLCCYSGLKQLSFWEEETGTGRGGQVGTRTSADLQPRPGRVARSLSLPPSPSLSVLVIQINRIHRRDHFSSITQAAGATAPSPIAAPSPAPSEPRLGLLAVGNAAIYTYRVQQSTAEYTYCTHRYPHPHLRTCTLVL